LVVELRVPSVTVANQTIDKVIESFQVAVAKLNQDQQAKLGVDRLTVKTPDGQIVVDWIDDLELTSGTGYWAPGITNYWFPSPPVGSSDTDPLATTSTLVLPTNSPALQQAATDDNGIQAVPTEQAQALAGEILSVVKNQSFQLGDYSVQSYGIWDSSQPLFVAELANPAEPRATICVVIQKNVSASAVPTQPNIESLQTAGLVSGYVRDSSPVNAQVVVLLPNGTTVNIASIGMKTDKLSIPMPINTDGLKKLAEVVIDQFGTTQF